jgi:BirA family transcriptional regulator, biotin operon repressor / biotin---[acetyl-CoA-carboxylase] ligase
MTLSDTDLDETAIRAAIAPASLYFFDQLNSTNSFAVKAAQQGLLQTPALILTPLQTHGRGRRDARWESSAGNLTMTVAYSISHSLTAIANEIPLLALRAGKIAVQSIQQIEPTIGLKLKWPNDLVIDNHKAGGILIETAPAPDGTILCIGVGINVNAPIELSISQDGLPPTSLSFAVQRTVNLTNLVVELSRALIELLRRFPVVNLPITDLEEILWSRGERVVVLTGKRAELGILEGINSQGAVVLRADDGTIREFFNGSLRRVDN